MVATDCAEDFRERNVEFAQCRVRGFFAVVLLLDRRRLAVVQMPHLVSKRDVLRHQQQSCQQYLHQAAFQNHGVVPISGKREHANTRQGGLQKPAQSSLSGCYILVCTI